MVENAGGGSFYAQGLRFTCVRCSGCCRHESGFVFLSVKDTSFLVAALKMEYGEFIGTFCRWVPSAAGEEQLSLKEKSNYDCIFWAAEGCSVYEARPLQCRAFPFWAQVVDSRENWKATAMSCPGMDQGALHARDSIENWLAQRQNEPIISRVAILPP